MTFSQHKFIQVHLHFALLAITFNSFTSCSNESFATLKAPYLSRVVCLKAGGMGAGMGADMYVAGDKKSSALLVLGLKLMLPHPTFYLGFENHSLGFMLQARILLTDHPSSSE